MSLFEAVVLGLVQGFTEFLPISSSGHLVLASWLFGWEDQGLAFDMAVHVGTIVAVFVYFRRDWIALISGALTGRTEPVTPVVTHGTTYDPATEPRFSGRRMVGLIILGTIPLTIVGLLFRADVEATARNPTYVGLMLLVTGAGLAAAEFFGRRDRPVNSLGVRDALLVGVGQALAAIPGISRSGATIAAGLFVNMTREGAARFSFFLAAPAILGSAGVVMLELLADDEVVTPDWGPMAVGTVVAFLSALVSIKFLMTLLQQASLRPFVVYCLLAGAAVILARAFGL